MELSSVYEIRDKLRRDTSEYSYGEADTQLDVAIGAAYGNTPKQYKLAVRLRGASPLNQWFKEKVQNEFADDELDILYTRAVRTLAPDSLTPSKVDRPFGIGSSIGYKAAKGGTVGFFAQKDGRLGVVSNNHVLAAEDQVIEGAEIIYPSLDDKGGAVVARLHGGYPRLGDPGLKQVDCAFAFLENDATPDMRSLGEGLQLKSEIAQPQENVRVRKIGRRTGITRGRITAFGLDCVVVGNYHFEHDVKFTGQIEIQSIDDSTFSDPGDSGSLVHTEDGRPVGLLFAETSIMGAANTGLHYANPMDAVLAALQVTLA